MQIKKWMLLTTSVLLLCPMFSTSVAASQKNKETGDYSSKDEVIYGNLANNGKMEEMYVVNSFHVTEPGDIVDYGDYTDIRNLTDLSEMKQTQTDEVHFQADEQDFFYQGTLASHDLPWDISITYLLDGEEVAPEDLAGQKGPLEMQITTSENEEVDPAFFENYVLQIDVTLDSNKFKHIQAPKGTEANEGKNKQISFMVLPEQEEELILSAYVTDLEMEPLNIAAVPANIAIDNPDINPMMDDVNSLSDAIRQVNSGVSELSEGISELSQGATELGNGSADYLNGINELGQNSNELTSGSEEIRDALKQISDGIDDSPDLPDMDDLTDLPDGMKEMSGGLREAAEGLETLKENYDDMYSNLDQAIADIPHEELSEEDIGELYESNADDEVVDQLIETYTAAQTVKQTYDAIEDGFASVSGTLDEIASPLNEMADQLDTIADEMEGEMDNLDQMEALTELQDGLTSLSSEYESFHEGLLTYTDGITSLADSYQDIHSGIEGFADGTTSFASGASELNEGTEELVEETNDLPEQMQENVNELMEDYQNEDFEPVSFVSDQNESVEVVQFVLQTEGIEKQQDSEETEPNDEKEEKGIWERFLDLFS